MLRRDVGGFEVGVYWGTGRRIGDGREGGEWDGGFYGLIWCVGRCKAHFGVRWTFVGMDWQ